MGYKAIIAKLENVRRHPNGDRLQIADVLGYNVIVGNNVVEGDIGIAFPEGGQISEEFLLQNNLYRKHPVTGKPMGGFFDANGRVRAIKLRGSVSDCFWIPIESLSYLNPPHLPLGTELNEINGKKLCWKYINKATERAIKRAQKKYKKPKWLPKFLMPIHKKYVLSKLSYDPCPDFHKHHETNQLRVHYKHIEDMDDVRLLYLTKCHGTCLVAETSIRMWDGSRKRLTKVKAGDYVVGYDGSKFVKSKVLDVFCTGRSDDWMIVKGNRRKIGMGNSFFRVECTSDHLFYTDQGYVAAKDLKIGSVVSQPRKDIKLSSLQKSILLGKMIGDGSLSHRDRASSIIDMSVTERYKDYLVKTLEFLGNVGYDDIRAYTSGYGSNILRARTIFSTAIQYEYKDFYNTGKKEVPEWVAEALDPISIAYWYMDDGSLSHSKFQKDRAAIATCAFNEQSMQILVKGLAKFDLNPVTYIDSRGYWRMRFNTEEAYKLFHLIAPYIHPCMRYKLPEEMREMYEFKDISSSAEECWVEVNDIVTSIEKSNRVSSQQWDMTTTTHNFVASDCLVHNSQRTGLVKYRPNTFLGRAANLFRIPKKYEYVSGSRNVTFSPYGYGSSLDTGYYSGSDFRQKAHNTIVYRGLKKDEVIYYELVGFSSPTTPIMPDHKLKWKDFEKSGYSKQDFQELIDTYGETITYHYGCKPGEFDILVYRITQGGNDLNWFEMEKRCKELNLKTVPLLVATYDNTNIIERAKDLSEGNDMPGQLQEGICLRVETREGSSYVYKNCYKAKSQTFCVLESIKYTMDDYVDEEEIN